LTGPPGSVPGERCVAFKHDSTRLATAKGSSIIIYNIGPKRDPEDNPTANWDAGQGIINIIAFRPAVVGQPKNSPVDQIVSAGTDGTVCIWEVGNDGNETMTHKKLHTLNGDKNSAVTTAVFSPDGLTVITGGLSKWVRIWNASDGNQIRELETHSGVYSVAVSKLWIAAACRNPERPGELKLWRAETGEEGPKIPSRNAPIRWVGFTPEGKRLAAACDDGTLAIYDLSTGRRVLSLNESASPLTAAVFSHEGTTIATANKRGTIRIYNPEP
jgi:WD40 repeat protein